MSSSCSSKERSDRSAPSKDRHSSDSKDKSYSKGSSKETPSKGGMNSVEEPDEDESMENIQYDHGHNSSSSGITPREVLTARSGTSDGSATEKVAAGVMENIIDVDNLDEAFLQGLPDHGDSDGNQKLKVSLSISKNEVSSRIVGEVFARQLSDRDRKLLDEALKLTIQQWTGKETDSSKNVYTQKSMVRENGEDPATLLSLAVNENGDLEDLRFSVRSHVSDTQQILIDRANTPPIVHEAIAAEREKAATQVQRIHRGHLARKKTQELKADMKRREEERVRKIAEEHGAIRIQAMARGKKARQEVRDTRERYNAASSKIQARWKAKQTRILVREMLDLLHKKRKREELKRSQKQKVKKVVLVDLHHVHHHHHFHAVQQQQQSEAQFKELESQAKQLTTTAYVENKAEGIYQGSYKNFIIDKIDPPYKSAEHYFTHMANMPPKERLGFSPYIYTADSRLPGSQAGKAGKPTRPPPKSRAVKSTVMGTQKFEKPFRDTSRTKRVLQKVKTSQPGEPPVLMPLGYTPIWPHDEKRKKAPSMDNLPPIESLLNPVNMPIVRASDLANIIS